MIPQSLASAVLAVAAASRLVAGQLTTACDPTKKTCPPNPALGKSVTCDFTKGPCDDFTLVTGPNVTYGPDGAVFRVGEKGDCPTIDSKKYIFFGKVEAWVQAAPGASIVTALVLASDARDEIDVEWVGSDNARVQSNYFVRGNDTTWDRGAFHQVATPTSRLDKYSVEWTDKHVQWSINDKVERTLKQEEAQGPLRSPMMVKFGVWSPETEGSQAWAGGPPDFSKGPFDCILEKLTVTDYAGGDEPAEGGVEEYVWKDTRGTRESIKVVGGGGAANKGSSSKSHDKQHNHAEGERSHEGHEGYESHESHESHSANASNSTTQSSDGDHHSHTATTTSLVSSSGTFTSTVSRPTKTQTSNAAAATTSMPSSASPSSAGVHLFPALGSWALVCVGALAAQLLL